MAVEGLAQIAADVAQPAGNQIKASVAILERYGLYFRARLALSLSSYSTVKVPTAYSTFSDRVTEPRCTQRSEPIPGSGIDRTSKSAPESLVSISVPLLSRSRRTDSPV
jgi:hypothetical protein